MGVGMAVDGGRRPGYGDRLCQTVDGVMGFARGHDRGAVALEGDRLHQSEVCQVAICERLTKPGS